MQAVYEPVDLSMLTATGQRLPLGDRTRRHELIIECPSWTGPFTLITRCGRRSF